MHSVLKSPAYGLCSALSAASRLIALPLMYVIEGGVSDGLIYPPLQQRSNATP